METKDKIYLIIIGVMMLFLFFGNWKVNNLQKKMFEKIEEANKDIISMDELKKESEGQYSKLVDYFSTEKDLLNKLKDIGKDSNLDKEQSKLLKELIKDIKKQDKRLLEISRIVFELKDSISKGQVTQVDSNQFALNLNYPDDGNSFINWSGSIFTNTKTYDGIWTFGELPINLIVTETERGLWESKLIGPSWLKVKDLAINSLPPTELPKGNEPVQAKLEFLLGGGFVKSFDPNIKDAFRLSTGFQWKNNNLIVVDGNTNGQVGLNYIHKFRRLKNAK